jgi:hypothetical protein
MKTVIRVVLIGAIVSAWTPQALAVDATTQSKLDRFVKEIRVWASDARIVNAVKNRNESKSADQASMTQDAWNSLSGVESSVRRFTQNAAAEFLKSKRTEVVAEAFVSAADGTKVAFLAKPTNWSHKGKAKHDAPMSGKTWQGQPEVDASTGFEQIQIAVPVLDGDQPIGSLVVGLVVARLKE